MASAGGSLTWLPLTEHLGLVGSPVALAAAGAPSAHVATIDPAFADTAAFCAAYDVPLGHSANCVIVAARRGDVTRYAAVMVLATMRADVNGVVRRYLGARRISFAPMEDAVRLTGMEAGGIAPVGLGADWPVLVDRAVVAAGEVVVGSGVRTSKLLLDCYDLARLPGAAVLDLSRADAAPRS